MNEKEESAEEKEIRRAKKTLQYSPFACPFCQSKSLDYANPGIEGGGAAQDVSCPDCGASWTEVYSMTEVILLKKGVHDGGGD